ncbi:general transcription factor II-I repeat domain-containing protein 2A-like [Diretmus argenteus]
MTTGEAHGEEEEKVAVCKEYNTRRHYSTKHAGEYGKYVGDEKEKRVGDLKKCLLKQQNLFKKGTDEADKAVEASYIVSEMLAKAGKPFTDGMFVKNCMMKVAGVVCPEKKAKFANVSLSPNTVVDRICDLSGNIYGQLRAKGEHFRAYSVCLDESTDITDTAQLAIHVRGVDDSFEVTEELLKVMPMDGRTTAQEIFRQLCNAITDAGLPWKRLVGLTTDGAPSMTGKRNGLVALVQRKLEEEGVEEAIALHCIIHQQALASKCLKFEHVMSVVVKTVNHIRSRGLKHRQFRTFLEEIESEYEDVVYFTEELNMLNKKLQGPNQLVSAAYDYVKGFSTKLVLWKAQLSQKNLCHFPACKGLVDQGTPFSGEKHVEAIVMLQEEFDHRFADFKTHRATFQIFADPFSIDVEDAPAVLQMELIDLQCSLQLKAKFREVSGNAEKLGQFLRELPPSFPELSRMFKRTMCLFGSTYRCEKLFSTLNFNKSKHRSRLTDPNLQAILRVATASGIEPNIAQLVERKHCQVSSSKE